MTRVSVYSAAIVAFLASTSMIIASIVMPNWVTYSVTTVKGDKIQKHIGLHRTCSTLSDPTCQEFPSRDLCQEGERYFCSVWRTAGFMTSFAAILCLATLVAFAVTLGGGKYKRETGWPFISGLMTLVTVVELAVISMVAYLYDHDGQFAVPGWHLDTSWYLALVSAIISLLIAGGMAVSAYLLPPEDGYEFLNEPLDP